MRNVRINKQNSPQFDLPKTQTEDGTEDADDDKLWMEINIKIVKY